MTIDGVMESNLLKMVIDEEGNNWHAGYTQFIEVVRSAAVDTVGPVEGKGNIKKSFKLV